MKEGGGESFRQWQRRELYLQKLCGVNKVGGHEVGPYYIGGGGSDSNGR